MCKIAVAPLVGAWIEIWQKELKERRKEVAPLVGAWIEIEMYSFWSVAGQASLPLWERGLKSNGVVCYAVWYESLPLWERGLKLFWMKMNN